MKKSKAKTDIQITNCGNIFMFAMLTKAARDWVEEHVQLEGYQFMGKESFAVEHSYAENLADGMMGDGLVVQ